MGLEKQDLGSWECEVGALIGDTFETATANIQLSEIKRKLGFYRLQNLLSGNPALLHSNLDLIHLDEVKRECRVQ